MRSLLLAVLLCCSLSGGSYGQRATDERNPERLAEPCVDVCWPTQRRDRTRPNEPTCPCPERPGCPFPRDPLSPRPCCLDATPAGKHILPLRDYLNPSDTPRQRPKVE